MKTVSNDYKEAIKDFGRQYDIYITYTKGNEEITINSDKIFNITINNEGNVLKSMMGELEIESSHDFEIGTTINLYFGILVNNAYEYIDYGKYIIKEKTSQKDTSNYIYKCYDEMLKSMINYDGITTNETFPMELDKYIKGLCDKLGYSFSNYEQEYTNNDLVLEKDYWDYDNTPYTYRDVLDQIAQVVGGFVICKNNTITIKYPTETNITIEADSLKDTNVNIEDVIMINKIISTRADGTDNVSVEDSSSIESNGEHSITIKENLMLNGEDRLDYINNILDRVKSISYVQIDIPTIGITYLELGDKFKLDTYTTKAIYPSNILFPSNMLFPGGKDGQISLSCMFTCNTIKINNGIEEQVFVNDLDLFNGDYVNSNATKITDKDTSIIVDKKLKEIDITADQIHLEGYTTINDGFSVDKDGNMVARSGEISIFKLKDYGFEMTISVDYDYNSADLLRVRKIILGQIEPTEEDYTKYDFNKDGKITSIDYIRLQFILQMQITPNNPAKFSIIAPTPENTGDTKVGYLRNGNEFYTGFSDNKFYLKGENLMSQIYPIGSKYYTGDSSFDPNDNTNVFPGVWTQISGGWQRTE